MIKSGIFRQNYVLNKFFKKYLTKEEIGGRILKLSREVLIRKNLKNFKKVEKKFKKGIDKAKAVWYNTKAAAKKGSENGH